MKTSVGVWVDHRRAVIATLADGVAKTAEILSHVERQPGRFEGVRSTCAFEAQQARADDSRDHHFEVRLNAYYDAVIEAIRDAERIFIFGPGEAKYELRGRLEAAKLQGLIVAVETDDKMTDRQVAARAREFFLRLDATEPPREVVCM